MEPTRIPTQENKRERGQVLVFIALAFVGMLSFIGLMTDIGILFISMGHLRRGVDSAALAASAQFREGRTYTEIRDSAIDFFELFVSQSEPCGALLQRLKQARIFDGHGCLSRGDGHKPLVITAKGVRPFVVDRQSPDHLVLVNHWNREQRMIALVKKDVILHLVHVRHIDGLARGGHLSHYPFTNP